MNLQTNEAAHAAPPTDAPSAPQTEGFYRGLREKVFAFLDEQGLDPIDDAGMRNKAIIGFTIWAASYALYLWLGSAFGWVALLAMIPMGFSLLCIMLSVMHDGSHSAFSQNRVGNRLAKWTLGFAGCSPTIWHKTHVQAHHGHTNIQGHDGDFEAGNVLRLHTAQERFAAHRYQHLYGWFLYSLHSLKWIWYQDFADFFANKFPMTAAKRRSLFIELLATRVWHFSCFLIVPALVTGSWSLAIVFYAVHWLLIGFALTVIFLMAHLTGVQEMLHTQDDAYDDWAIHQLATTANYAPHNKALSWVIGGLNFQIEHHIFPKLSHTRHALIRPIVKQHCESHGVAYHEYPTFRAVLADHYRNLKTLGKPLTADAI